MDEGRKRVLAIVAGILVARHLKTADDPFDSKNSHARNRWSQPRSSGPSGS